MADIGHVGTEVGRAGLLFSAKVSCRVSVVSALQVWPWRLHLVAAPPGGVVSRGRQDGSARGVAKSAPVLTTRFLTTLLTPPSGGEDVYDPTPVPPPAPPRAAGTWSFAFPTEHIHDPTPDPLSGAAQGHRSLDFRIPHIRLRTSPRCSEQLSPTSGQGTALSCPKRRSLIWFVATASLSELGEIWSNLRSLMWRLGLCLGSFWTPFYR